MNWSGEIQRRNSLGYIETVDKQISKEEMERILENLENEEEKIQAKLATKHRACPNAVK